MPSKVPTLPPPTADDLAWGISARGCEDFLVTPPPKPTSALPGTREKLEVFTWRAQHNHDLFHPLDRFSRLAPVTEMFQALLEDRKDVQPEIAYSPPCTGKSTNGDKKMQDGYYSAGFEEVDEHDEQEAITRRQQLKEKLMEKRQPSPAPLPPVESKSEQVAQPSQPRKKPGPRPGPKRKKQAKPQKAAPVPGKGVPEKQSWRQKKAANFAQFVETVRKLGGIRAVRAKLDELESMLR